MSRIISWKIWSAIQHPPRANPLFQRVYRQRENVRLHRSLGVLLFVAALLLGYRAIELHLTIISLLFWLTPGLLLGIIGGSVAIYGLTLALAVSGALNRAHEQKIYELLCLAPPGEMAATWAISTGSLTRKKTLDWFYRVVQLVAGLAISGLVLGLAILLLALLLAGNDEHVAQLNQPALEVTHLLVMLLACYGGVIQAISASVLVGMLVPTFFPDTAFNHIYSIGVYLVLQALGILLAVLVGLFILPAFYELIRWNGWLAEASLSVLRLLVFFAIQESINRTLWRTLTKRLNALSTT